jgi:hypothetical protein
LIFRVLIAAIPGRTEGASPESRQIKRFSWFWIPGSALRAAPE